MRILHNPRCSKSRQALQLLEEKGKDLEVVRYLDTPLNQTDIENIIQKLGSTDGMIRVKDKGFAEASVGYDIPRETARFLAENPKFMQRPIVLDNGRAVIVRPPNDDLSEWLKEG